MDILLVSATEKEIEPSLQKDFSSYAHKVTILITGVGAAATAYHLTKKLGNANFEIVLQVGIAGCFNTETKLGKVVVVERDAFADLGTEQENKFQTIFQAGLGQADELPFSNGWLMNDHSYLQKTTLPKVRAVSVNKVSDSLLQKQQLISAFNPEIETMEGAAFHYVCLQEKIPFLQIRATSNYVGERNKANWKMKEAIKNLNEQIERIIIEL